MASGRTAQMGTVKIPRKLYESALQAWTQVVESANQNWRRIRSGDNVSKLETRLGVQIHETGDLKEHPFSNVTQANAASGMTNDIQHDLLERALKEDASKSQPGTPMKTATAERLKKPVTPNDSPVRQADLANRKKMEEVQTKVEDTPLDQDEIDAKSRYLIHAISKAELPSVVEAKLSELSQHILKYPDCRPTLIKEKALSTLIKLKGNTSQTAEVLGRTRECLSLLGYVEPPKSPGVRILSIDGGGVRGVVVIEVLRQLEICTGKKITELFDYIVGVSTGAILVGLIAALQKDLDECEALYRGMSSDVFNQSSWWGTGKLVWNHAYYDTNHWQEILQTLYGDIRMIDTSRVQDMPRVGILSSIVNRATLVPFLFRNYQLPPKDPSYYQGACDPALWQAVRASSSAPFYFEEFELNGAIHQDGGVMQNNPTAAAIHEARHLWPNENIQCVVSIGSGRYIPQEDPNASQSKSTSLKTKILKIVDSATDTEAVHTLCNDLLPAGSYFRFNPYLSEPFTLDETCPKKMDLLRLDAQMYLRRNDKKFEHAAALLVQQRSLVQKCSDYLRDNIQERLV